MAVHFQRRKNKKNRIWQDEFHAKAIHTPEFLLQKMEYMHNNPVRKGLVLRPENWRHSSARTYLNGEENDVKICMDQLFDIAWGRKPELIGRSGKDSRASRRILNNFRE
jgi:hypothetical protein